MPGRSLSWRRTPEILDRMERAYALFLQNYSYRRIAAELGVSVPIAWKDVEHARQLARERVTDDVVELRRQACERLNAVEQAAWEAVPGSQGAARSALLSVVSRAEETKARLLGLFQDKPAVAIQATGPAVFTLNIDRASPVGEADEELPLLPAGDGQGEDGDSPEAEWREAPTPTCRGTKPSRPLSRPVEGGGNAGSCGALPSAGHDSSFDGDARAAHYRSDLRLEQLEAVRDDLRRRYDQEGDASLLEHLAMVEQEIEDLQLQQRESQ